MSFLFFVISFLSSIIGAISGIGGGIIIKPVLDATTGLNIGTISFLSGCTVLSMSTVSLLRSYKSKVSLDIKSSTALAIGGIIGGVIGSYLFNIIKDMFGKDALLGIIQSGILLSILIGVLIYIRNKANIHTHYITNVFAQLTIGICLGSISSFLGIGGGPMNIVILYFFFSMNPKTAALNSLFIIFFSQLASLFTSLTRHTVPDFDILILIFMILGGICGALLGSKLFIHFKEHHVEKLFVILLLVIAGVNIYNLIRLSFLL